ncbi:two-component system sensor histidine kinase NtrB [Nisaea denitrificans]|uniref:two-component system sensor histidine kinase NtrB n=1 Tax=Nisaea denitrificans TaxID=390877 RepID=UPI000425B510|nr:ATP-binding protein [Nisaea denitrificans]
MSMTVETAAMSASVTLDPASVLHAVPTPVIGLDESDRIVYVNMAAEHFLQGSASVLQGTKLSDLMPFDSPVFSMIGQSRRQSSVLFDYDLILEGPRIGSHIVSVQVSPVTDRAGAVIVSLQMRSIANQLYRQFNFKGAARSVTAMAAMLAHEVKNPLSGIKGAAQLLEQNAVEADLPLTKLICDETDRICSLVDRMEVFSDDRPIERSPVNIHEVLDHCQRIAETGFGSRVKYHERYDPSLPPVLGNRDILVQIFLNLLKNASEALDDMDGDGEIHLSTAYRHGMRISVPGSSQRVNLPLQVTIRDNGPGIPEDMKATIFDPFVTSKRNGSGLGLAFVAKAVADHGGVIEVDSVPRRTEFRISLPIADISQASIRA